MRMSKLSPRNLLWVDCTAGAVVGLFVLALSGWLGGLYELPRSLLLFTGAANLLYAAYSFSLAIRSLRPRALLYALVIANGAWAVVCLGLAAAYGGSASMFGLGHLLAEALFVGGLAVLEWRYRAILRTAN